MNITEVEDLTMFCRVCLQIPEENDVLDLNLIYDEEEQLTYYDCFTMCTQINLADEDGLPQNLCRGCCLELQMAYDFYKKVEESKRFLAQLQDQQAEAAVATADAASATTQEAEPEDEEEEEEVDEEHLELEEYQAVEQLDDEDSETIQIKINEKSDGEEYVIEAITLADDDEMEETANRLQEQITWEDAVVTVANEQHLPVKTEGSTTIKTEPSTEVEVYDAPNMFEYEEILEDVEEGVDRDDEKPKNPTAHEMKRTRVHYSGKFDCDYCQKTFPSHSRMLMHRRSHQADRPKFPCTECDRVYATKQAMEVHMRAVHIKNGFVCPICSKLYVIKKSLEVHMRYHTGDFPYVCDLCGRKFAQIGHLNTHTNVKHNNVRFSCEYPNCGKFFTSSTSLRNHEFSHGEMPFQCSHCDKGYPSKSKLKVHIRRKHDLELTLEQLEPMRKFKTSRSKLSLIKVVECED